MARSPLFDYYDPYGVLEQQAQMGLLSGRNDEDPYESRRLAIEDLMPEEQKSGLLRSLAETGMSGLQYAGWLLDTPGAIVRGVLAGKPLSGFGSTDERVSGRDLLREWGAIGRKDTIGNFVGGLAGEILLDPLTYLNPLAVLGRGALTRGVGKPLQKAGLLRDAPLDAARGYSPAPSIPVGGFPAPPSVGRARDPSGVREYLRNLTADQAFAEARARLTPDEYNDAVELFTAAGGRMGDTRPAAGLMSIGLPGTGLQYDIYGGAFGDALASGLDSLGEWSKRAPVVGPLTRLGAMAFDANVGYSMDPDVQMAHRIMRADARTNVERARRAMSGLQQEALRATVPDTVTVAGAAVPVPEELRRGFASPGIQNAFADWLDSPNLQGPTLSGVPLGKTSGDAVADALLENVPEYRAMRDALYQIPGDAVANARERALPLPVWTSRLADTDFFPRQQFWFDQDSYLPTQLVNGQRPYTRGDRLFGLADNFGRQRRQYTDIPGGRRTFRSLTAGPDARQLQDALLAADAPQSRKLIDDWFDRQGIERPYERLTYGVTDPDELRAATGEVARLKDELADFLRRLDRQYAEAGVGVFDTPVFADAMRYVTGQARVSAASDQLVNQLTRTAQNIPAQNVPGNANMPLLEAASELGFDRAQFEELWESTGRGSPRVQSVDRRTVAALRALAQNTRLGMPESAASKALDSFTRLFKAGALAWPAFHTRNSYSNVLSIMAGNATPGGIPAAIAASRGDYGPIADYLANAPLYRNLTRQQRMERFARDAAAAGVGSGTVFDDIAGLPEQSFTRLAPGPTPETNVLRALGSFYDPGRTWGQFAKDFGTIRGVGISRPAGRTRNPIFQLNDAVGLNVENASRLGMFADLLRQGYVAGEAGDQVRRMLIDYSPDAFSAVERDFFKRVVPFYSFQRGQIPAIADNLLYRPGGLQGQSVRAVTRASEPTDDNFIPERFRRSSAVPLPYSPGEGLQRYLTNLDLPWESTFNLLTPGVGPSFLSALGDTLQQTASNLLGQTNPLIKAPLEFVTDRQLYSGQQLSDAYSILEAEGVPGGRGIEQIVQNFVPFGTRALGLYRQIRDDRLSPADRALKAAVNTLAGVKLTDVDQERSKQLAARKMLTEMLKATPGVRTYENIALDEESLARLTPEQRDRYLLYRIIQAEAARRARERAG